MKKIILISILLVIGTLAYGGYTYVREDDFTTPIQFPAEIDIKESEDDRVPKSWKFYSNKQMGISLKYPKEWDLRESSNTQNIPVVIISGQGYRFIISRLDHGFEQEGVEYNSLEYKISGQQARAWEYTTENSFRLIVSPSSMCNGYSFSSESKSTNSREVIDGILSSVVCQ